MYGMIHTAAREMVVSELGQDTWDRIKDHHNLQEDLFVSGEVYDDQVTYALIDTIAEETQLEKAEVLKRFGEFWIKYTAASSYNAVYKMYGKDLFSFLENLNRMHGALEATLPKAQTPTFECMGRSEKQIEILYCSKRQGLEAIVIGLFEGLMTYFGVTGTVEQGETTDTGVLFRVTVT